MTLPDLDDLIAEVDRRCGNALRPGDQEQPDWLALLTVASQLAGQTQALADDLVEDHVEHCRMHGTSRTDIGGALGVIRQAVQQRNNYIGTEHLLWGLTAQDNGATRLLRAVGVSPDTIHHRVGTRLSMGASQAAERIAWTPYCRKAIAVAEERSVRNGCDLIDCADLLAGLAQVDRGVAADVLTEAGSSLAEAEAAPDSTPAGT